MSKKQKIEPTPLCRKVEHDVPSPKFKNIVLANAVSAIKGITLAPETLAFQAVLAQVAIVGQAFVDVETLGGTAPASLMLMTVAASSERKSTCDRLASAKTREIHAHRVGKFEAKRKRIASRSSNRINDTDDLVDDEVHHSAAQDSSLVNPAILLTNTTIEGLLVHWENGNPSVGLFNDDAGQFFGGYSMRKENRLNTAATLSRIWDGQTLDRQRAGTEFQSFPGRRATMHFALQPDAAKSVLADATLLDQGLLSRALVAFPESRVGKRFIAEPETRKENVERCQQLLKPFYDRIASLLLRQPALDPVHERVLQPRLLVLNSDARIRLTGFYNGIERAVGRGGTFEHISAFACKIPEQTCRIAALLTVFEDPDETAVTLETMEEAIEISEWFLIHMQHLQANGWADPETRDADRLRQWLLERKAVGKVTCRELIRTGPPWTKDAKQTLRLMGILETHGWVSRLPKGAKVNGVSAKDAWEVCHE